MARPSALVAGERKVGVPSMVVIIGFKRPPFSNSCAEILRTGVVAPVENRKYNHEINF